MATLTTNKNFLSPVGFQFTIDRQKFPNIEYFCTAVSLPSISLASVEVPYKGVALTEPGNRLEFGELTLAFNVTENLENYIETFNWMHDFVNTKGDYKEDATLLILNSHNNLSKEVRFNGIFPTNLDALEFDTKSGVEYFNATVTFEYTSYEFK
tara:strand:+ start:4230 stop:4691 length:462 start_codon:yes stop_codon:yes gene_type:complete